MASLLDSADPVMSLLGNLASVGQVGSTDKGGVNESGGTLLSQTQRSTASDSLLAAGAALANAGAARFGPQPTLAQGLTQGLLAGSIAGQSAQERAVNQQQAQQIMAQSAQDADLRRRLIEQHLQKGELVKGFITNLPQMRAGQQAAPAADTDTGGGRPGDAIREVLRGKEQDQRGYGSVNAGGYTGAFQIGSDLASDAGFYLPADPTDIKNQWRGTFRIPGHPDVRTRDDFLRSGPAQEQAFTLAAGHIDKMLQEGGVYDRVAQKGNTVNGMPVTRDGLIMGAWLGGVRGLTNWVDRGADAADGNRTRVSQYVQAGSQASARPAAAAAPAPAPAPAPAAPVQPVRVAEGGVSPILTDAGGAGPAMPTPTIVTPGAAVPGPTIAATAPPAPVRPAAPAAASSPQDIMRGATREQLLGVLMSDDPAKALMELTNKPLVTRKSFNQRTGLMEERAVNNRGEAYGPVLGTPEKPDYHYDTTIRDGVIYNTRQLPGQNAEITGPAGKENRIETFWNAETKQGERWAVDAAGNKVGDKPKGLTAETPHFGTTTKDGKNYNTVQFGDGPARIIDEAALPPNALPLTKTRADQDVTQAGDIETAKETAKLAAKESGDIYAGRNRAQGMTTQLNMLEAVSHDIPSGPGLESAVQIGKLASQLGLDLKSVGAMFGTQTAVKADVFKKIVNGLVLGQLGGEGMPRQAFSDRDLRFLEEMNPQLTNLPESNTMLVNYARAMQGRAVEYGNAWSQWARKNGEGAQSLRDFQADWATKIENDPLVRYVPNPDDVKALPPNRIWWTDQGPERRPVIIDYTDPRPPERRPKATTSRPKPQPNVSIRRRGATNPPDDTSFGRD
jgi:hypothetical protein